MPPACGRSARTRPIARFWPRALRAKYDALLAETGGGAMTALEAALDQIGLPRPRPVRAK